MTHKPKSQDKKQPKDNPPPAGPHARPDLVDESKTPGTGALPDKKGGEADVGSE